MARSLRISPRDARSLVLTVAAVASGSGFAGRPRPMPRQAAPFLAHQALYDLSLVKSRGSNSINSARGRILYNFSGSACEGYTSEFRQVSELDSGEDKVTLSDLRSTSWEDGAGKSYRFKIDARMNDADSSPVDGVAERDRRPRHGQTEAAGGQDLHARRQHGVSDRADPAHHRGGAGRKIRARADGL